MAVLNLTYGSLAFLKVVNVNYDDVAHTVVSGSLGEFDIPTGLGEGAVFYTQDIPGVGQYKLKVLNTSPFASVEFVPIDLDEDLSIDDIVITNAMNGNSGIAQVYGSGSGTLRYGVVGVTAQTAVNIFNLPAGNYIARLSRTEDGYYVDQAFTIEAIDDLQVHVTSTNETIAGADDGKISISILQGSGEYRIHFDFDSSDTDLIGEEVTYYEKTGLEAGLYTFTVEDLVTGQILNLQATITAPVVIPPANELPGTILEFSILNSLRWIVDPIESNASDDATLDNVPFCKINYPNFKKSNYYQKVCFSDGPVSQFNSDYQAHLIQLLDYKTNEVIKTFGVILKEQNIGITEDYQLSIQPHPDDATKSRVYFSVGSIPIPLFVNDPFEILNNLESFDGTYLITAIENDDTLGYQYLIINKAYDGAGAYSSATGRFLSGSEDFNVFETIADLSDVDEGEYYLKATATDNLGNVRYAITEPILLKDTHPKTNLLTYRNEDNCDDITWTTGYTGKMRVESLWGHRPQPGGERSVSRNSDYSLVKNSSKKTRGQLFETKGLPPWKHEQLSCIFDLDYVKINNVEVQSAEGYAEAQYADKYKLGHSSIIVEQVRWFRKYNSDDISSVVQQGFIIGESGFIKR